jgi:integrase
MTVCTRKKDGQVFVQWDEDGKTKREYFGIGLEAKARARERNLEVTKKTPVSPGLTFVKLADAYLNVKKDHFSEDSYKSIRWRFTKNVLPHFGPLVASKLRHEDFDKFVRLRSRSVKKSSIRRELADVRAILRWSVGRKYITHNPMAGFKFPPKDDVVVQAPSQSEIERIVANAAPHLRRAVLLSFFLGLRPGAVELLSIKYSQINWSAMTIHIVSANKGGVKSREVPIHSALPLHKWYVEDGGLDDRHIITYRGKPIKAIASAFNGAKKRAGIPEGKKMPPYSLRHAFVTTLLHSGVDIHTIASISGHDAHTLLQHYAHAMDNVRVAAIAALPPITINEQPKKGVRKR